MTVGVIMATKARPVGRKRMSGAEIVASFEFENKFWRQSDMPKKSNDSSHMAKKSLIAIPKLS